MSALPRVIVLGLVVLVACAVMPGCERQAGEGPAPKVVAVTIYPLADLVRQMAGEEIEVVCLVAPGQSPHGFEPTARQMNQLANSGLVVMVGLGLDDWAERAARAAKGEGAPPMFRFADAVELDGAESDHHADAQDHEHHGHEHGHDDAHDHHHDHGGHAHGPVDPHVWLDPMLVSRMVRHLESRLVQTFPDEADAIAQRAEQLRERLGQLDSSYREQLGSFQGRAIVTYHSAFNRLADRYGLEVAATLAPIESMGSRSARALNESLAAIRKHELKVIFAEPQFDPAVARSLREQTGVEVLILDPLGDPHNEERDSYIELMEYNLRTLVKGLRMGQPGT